MSSRSPLRTIGPRTLAWALASLASVPSSVLAAPSDDSAAARVAGAGLGLSVDMPFGDGAVLQRDLPIGVSGRARAGVQVTVSFDGQVAEATPDASGRWAVSLGARPASAFPEALVVEATAGERSERLELTNIVVGDVWVAAGLEDMARSLAEGGVLRPDSVDAPSHVRLFVPEPAASLGDVVWTPRERHRVRHAYLRGEWHSPAAVDPDAASALAWHLALRLGAGSRVPVGVVQLSTGPSTLDSWIPRPRLLANDSLAPRLVGWWTESSVPGHVRERARRNLAGAFDAADNVADAGVHPFQPGFLWHHAVLPLEHFAVAGVVWASGSFALEGPEEHEYLMHAWVRSWRERLRRPELPIVLVESTAADLLADPGGEAAALRRDAERRLCADDGYPAVELVVTRDLALRPGGPGARADETSRRVATSIDALTSERVGLHQVGPRPTSIAVDPSLGEVRVSFAHGAGLQAVEGDAVLDVRVVGADGRVRVANARIDAGDLVASHPAIRLPVEVRYGWGPAWEGNLVNAHGLPAPTFRMRLPTSAVAGGR